MIAQQVLIGLTMGFAARVVFAAIEFAGEIVGLQMGLNFASFFDPMSGAQSTSVSRFYGTCAAWLFARRVDGGSPSGIPGSSVTSACVMQVALRAMLLVFRQFVVRWNLV